MKKEYVITAVVSALYIVIAMVFSSCNFINKMNGYDNYVESLEFKTGKQYVDKGDCVVMYLTVSPADSFSYYKTEYSVSDNTVISFEECTNNYCIVRGLKEGSTVVSAKVGSCEAKCVVTCK